MYAIRLSLGGLFALAALAGCGDSSLSEVSGTVTVDDQPIEKGAISFFPVDGKTKTTGGDIVAGSYKVQVPVGKMSVKISKPKVAGMKKLYNTPDSPSYPMYTEALPDRYNEKTTLTLDVTPGGLKKDWELKGK